MAKMYDKFKKSDFGHCPRVMCDNHPLLPVGLTDTPYQKGVKLFCGKCEDVYNPKLARHVYLDGAFFGTSFAPMFYQVYADCIPEKSDKYVPKIFGFKVRNYRVISEDTSNKVA